MTRITTESGRATLIMLVGCCAVAGPAAADAPDATDVAVVDALTTASVDVPAAVNASPDARDRLLELVVEYLELAFARNAQDTRTAQLELRPVDVVQ